MVRTDPATNQPMQYDSIIGSKFTSQKRCKQKIKNIEDRHGARNFKCGAKYNYIIKHTCIQWGQQGFYWYKTEPYGIKEVLLFHREGY